MHNIQHITETKASAERLSRPSRVPCQVEGPWAIAQYLSGTHKASPHLQTGAVLPKSN